MKKYLFSYLFDGKKWSIEIFADCAYQGCLADTDFKPSESSLGNLQ